MAFERIGRILLSNKDASDMRKAINMNLIVSQRELRRGKKVKQELDIFRAARRLFEI